MSHRIDELVKKREALDERIRLLKNRARTEERKRDTRRKILIGSVILKMKEEGELPEEKLRQMLDQHLSKGPDRALFGLPKLKPST